MLVLGPNPVFLRYVAGVLPSLGETAVLQTTLEGLVAARWPVTEDDPDEVARLKGDGRMARADRSAGRRPDPSTRGAGRDQHAMGAGAVAT